MPRRPALSMALAAIIVCGALDGAEAAPPFRHDAWNDLLGRFVKGDSVAYAAWRSDDAARARLDAYLAALATATPSRWRGRNARMALWINAYNACVVARVLADPDLKNVMEAPGFFSTPFCDVAGRRRSLDDIEKGVLRQPALADPRLHFALNCASRSCPRLQPRAWTKDGLPRRLDEAAKAFITGGGARVEGSTLRASKLFEWYADDFKSVAPTVREFIARYLPAAGRGDLKLAFDPYDWALNGR